MQVKLFEVRFQDHTIRALIAHKRGETWWCREDIENILNIDASLLCDFEGGGLETVRSYSYSKVGEDFRRENVDINLIDDYALSVILEKCEHPLRDKLKTWRDGFIAGRKAMIDRCG